MAFRYAYRELSHPFKKNDGPWDSSLIGANSLAILLNA